MAAYPSYNILLVSTPEIEEGIDDDYSQGGTQHSRIFYSAPYYNFTVLHQLSLAQYNSLMATYLAGRRDVYTFPFYDESPQVTYSVKFTDAPQITQNIDGGRFIVEVRLRGQKD